jgi:hypothetical protein
MILSGGKTKMDQNPKEEEEQQQQQQQQQTRVENKSKVLCLHVGCPNKPHQHLSLQSSKHLEASDLLGATPRHWVQWI